MRDAASTTDIGPENRRVGGHPDEEQKIFSNKILSVVWECTDCNICQAVGKAEWWSMPVVRGSSSDAGTPLPGLQPLESWVEGALESGWTGNGLECRKVSACTAIRTVSFRDMWSGCNRLPRGHTGGEVSTAQLSKASFSVSFFFLCWGRSSYLSFVHIIQGRKVVEQDLPT